MSLSKKYYKIVAEVFQENINDLIKLEDKELVLDVAKSLCDKFEEDNFRFDRIKFMNACRGV